jgi:hypothetical protein
MPHFTPGRLIFLGFDIADKGSSYKMASSESTRVKVIGTPMSVMCENADCGRPARYLFRTGFQRIRAYCHQHAAATARSLGIELPIRPDIRRNL